MADFSIQDAAYAGFRVARERPRALLIWVGVSILMQLVIQGALFGFAGPTMAQLTAFISAALANPGNIDFEKLTSLYSGLLPAYVVILPFDLVFNGVLYAAMNRVILKPNVEGFGYFRLGGDELRQIGLRVVLGLMFLGVLMGGAFITGLLMALIQPLAVFGAAAATCVLTVLWVRLSLASAVTFQTAQVDLFGSWTLTRGRFWPIFGAYLLAGLLTMVVVLLAGVVIGAVGALLNGGSLKEAATQADYWTLRALMTPARLAPMLLNGALGALLWPIVLTPGASVYQQLTGRFGAGVAEAFR